MEVNPNVGWTEGGAAVDETFGFVVDVMFAGDDPCDGTGVGVDVEDTVSDFVAAGLLGAFNTFEVVVAAKVYGFSASALGEVALVVVDGEAEAALEGESKNFTEDAVPGDLPGEVK